MRRDVYVALACLAVGSALGFVAGWFARRRSLRQALRRKMRRLGMLVPCVALLWAGVEVERVAAQVPTNADSLILTSLVRTTIGQWTPNAVRPFCITWYAEREHLVVLLDAQPADTTVRPICVSPNGGRYPVLLDGPSCPDVIHVSDRQFLIVRCGDNAFNRYWRQP